LLAMERVSEHPLAQALVRHLEGQEPVTISDFESLTGKGVKARFQGQWYFVGNLDLLKEQGIALPSHWAHKQAEWENSAQTVIGFGGGGEALALVALSDALKPGSPAAIEELKSMSMELHLLTGDNQA